MFDWWNVFGLIIGGICLGAAEQRFADEKPFTLWYWWCIFIGLTNIGISVITYYHNFTISLVIK